MPASMTFTSLQAQLQSYLERGGSVTDPTVFSQLPALINLAELSISRRLKILGQIVPMLSTLNANVPVYSKPNNWRRTISMNFGTGTGQNTHTPLFPRSYEYCRAYWPDDTVTGPPEFYADYDFNHWFIVPTPATNYPWEIIVSTVPQLLDSTNQTNFWTNFTPEVLLYRALLECTPFLKNDERIQTWKGMYEEAITNLNTEDLLRVPDRAAVRKEA